MPRNPEGGTQNPEGKNLEPVFKEEKDVFVRCEMFRLSALDAMEKTGENDLAALLKNVGAVTDEPTAVQLKKALVDAHLGTYAYTIGVLTSYAQKLRKGYNPGHDTMTGGVYESDLLRQCAGAMPHRAIYNEVCQAAANAASINESMSRFGDPVPADYIKHYQDLRKLMERRKILSE